MSTYFDNESELSTSDWISQAEAARTRGVTRQAISKLVKQGRLRTLVVGGRTFVSKSDVLAFEPRPAGRPKEIEENDEQPK